MRIPWVMSNDCRSRMSPFVPMIRELTTMHYLWQRPHRPTTPHCVPRSERFPHTPLKQAVGQAVAQAYADPCADQPAASSFSARARA
jgi:hypothetical protein